MIQVKICGITNCGDALAAVEAGANALGFVLAPSPRKITPVVLKTIVEKLPPFVLRVGVVTPESSGNWPRLLTEGVIDLLQIHGNLSITGLSPARLIKVLAVGRDHPAPEIKKAGYRALLLDTYYPGMAGGTGKVFPWTQVARYRSIGLPLLLAGGLKPENIQDALDIAKPAGVDVSSGVESYPGKKDWGKIKAFLREVRSWEKEKGGNYFES
jgi:phosphoribosylanthranilate isomerase